MKVGYVYDERMLLHSGNKNETPDRIIAVLNELSKRNYLEKMIHIDSMIITYNELLLAHDKIFIDKMIDLFKAPEHIILKKLKTMDSMSGNKHSLDSAFIAAGSSLNLMKNIISGNIKHGIAIVRPPGHHCTNIKASGFCFFNNAAISAKYCLENNKKVAIVDIDIHYFNGTANILNKTKNCLSISIHRHDYGAFYPNTGLEQDTKYILSIPINNIEATDNDYNKIVDEQVIPALQKHCPDIIIISAGFDAMENDPIGGYKLSSSFYYGFVNKLLLFNKPILIILEGGYNLNNIANGFAECTRALLENTNSVM